MTRGGGTSSDVLNDVAVHHVDGSVVSVGAISSSAASFGGLVLSTAGSSDAVVWKTNSMGTTLWSVRGGGTSGDSLTGVAMDNEGAVVAAGSFQSSTATFGGDVLSKAGGSLIDAMVWKLSSMGTTLWVLAAPGSFLGMNCIAVDDAGGAIATAGYVVGVGTFGSVVLTSMGSGDAVVWKLSPQGTTLWAVRGGGTDAETTSDVAVDSSGAVVAAGYFSAEATFGNVVLSSAGSKDAMVWKLSPQGTTLWVVRGGGTSDEWTSGVVVDGGGAVVSAGFLSSTATFGGEVLTSAGSKDAVAWKLSSQGTTLWAVRGGGTSDDSLSDVAVDGADAVLATGYYKLSLIHI